MAQYATPTDLIGGVYGRSQEVLTQLADDVNTPKDFNAANTQAMLNGACESGSNWVRSFVLGRLDLADTQVLADLKRWTVIAAMHALYFRRQHYGPANPYYDLKKEVEKELVGIRDGVLKTGETTQLQREVYATTQDTTSHYDRSDDSSFLTSF